MDDQFNLIPNIEEKFNDLNSLYLTQFQTQSLDLLQKYNLKYLVFTPSAQDKYQIKNFIYLNKECFEQIYNR